MECWNFSFGFVWLFGEIDCWLVMDGWLERWIIGWLERLIVGWLERLIVGWLERWMVGLNFNFNFGPTLQ